MKWAPGPIDDWVSGGQGWILWVSLSIMVADSLVSFIVLSVKSVQDFIVDYRSRQESYTQALELQQSLINEAENRGSGDGDNNKPILNGDLLKFQNSFLFQTRLP